MSCIDFFDNYAFKVQNQIQYMYWFSFQITILVHITYRLNPYLDETNLESKILKDIHYYICDEKDHDTIYVQHASRLQWQFMQERRFFTEHHVVWSNGCAGQFKSAHFWFFISRYHNSMICIKLPIGCQMTWNYFTTSHGKGEVDGTRTLLK